MFGLQTCTALLRPPPLFSRPREPARRNLELLCKEPYKFERAG